MRDWQNIMSLCEFSEVSVVAVQGSRAGLPSNFETKLRLYTTLDSLHLENPPQGALAEMPLNSAWWKNRNGHPLEYLWTPFRHEALKRLASQHRFALVIIEDIMLWRFASALPGSCPIVIDCHNVQSQQDAEHASAINWLHPVKKALGYLMAYRMRRIELNHRRLHFFVCSEPEAAVLARVGIPESAIDVVYNVVDWIPDLDRPPSPQQRHLLPSIPTNAPVILYAGVYDYEPNGEAASTLIRKIYPLLRKEIPETHLLFIGRQPTFEMARYAYDDPQILITGEVLDAYPYFRRATVMSVPLKQGGGTRFKILQAFAYGLPVVSSIKGGEGLRAHHGRHLMIADSPAAHAAALLYLIREGSARERMIEAAWNLVAREYDSRKATEQIRSAVSSILARTMPRAMAPGLCSTVLPLSSAWNGPA